MKKLTIIFIIIIMVLLSSCAGIDSFDNEIISLINQVRIDNGLNELQISSDLNNAALKRCEYIINTNQFKHMSLINFIPNRTGHSIKVGEVLALGEMGVKAQDYINAWLASPTHRDVILNPKYNFSNIGIASVEWGDKLLIVVLFSSE